MDATRAIRKSGYSQRELARLMGLTDAQFTKKKTGWRGMHFSSSEIRTLALYGVPVAELFPEIIEAQS